MAELKTIALKDIALRVAIEGTGPDRRGVMIFGIQPGRQIAQHIQLSSPGLSR